MDKKHYIDRFASSLSPYKTRGVEKTWYKQKFEWRVEFYFPSDRTYFTGDRLLTGGYPLPSKIDWIDCLREWRAAGHQFRTRVEGGCSVYTNDFGLLENIANNEDLREIIQTVEYTDDVYLKDKNNVDEISVTDIKYVARVPEHKYKVTLWTIPWRGPERGSITRYLVENRDSFIFRNQSEGVIERAAVRIKQNRDLNYDELVREGFTFFASNLDDIIMIHMIAPGCVGKIVQMMERNYK